MATRTSAPAANAAWSRAERCQLWYWASARVPVATASTASSTGPLWVTVRLLICQLASAAPRCLLRAISRSMARAASGSSRSRIRPAAASASAGAALSTGSMPSPPVGRCATAE